MKSKLLTITGYVVCVACIILVCISCEKEPINPSYKIVAQDQGNTNWCWATSESMILNFKGISVTKEDVVIDYYGSLVNEGGETLKIHKQLCKFLNKDIDKDSFYNNEGFKREVKNKVINCLNTGVVLYERFKVGGHVLVI